MTEDSWEESWHALFFGEVQVSMAYSCCFHLDEDFVILKVVIEVDFSELPGSSWGVNNESVDFHFDSKA